jgi:adenylate kinase
MARPAIFDLFSLSGLTAGTKLVMLGSTDLHRDVLAQARSLNIEHVSPSALSLPKGLEPVDKSQGRTEISRPPVLSGQATLALMRRWFFARKPDAGFVLADFPATLLQALVFDEWMEARDEAIDAALSGPGSPASVVSHYRELGILADCLSTFAPLRGASADRS